MISSDGGMGRAAKGDLFSEGPIFCFTVFFFNSYFHSLIRKIRF